MNMRGVFGEQAVNRRGICLNNLRYAERLDSVRLACYFMMKLGRNDPCHCGSGKKYKKCHLDADERNRTATRLPVVDKESQGVRLGDEPQWEDEGQGMADGSRRTEDGLDLARGRLGFKDVPKMLRQLTKNGTIEGRKQIEELIAETAPMIEYLEQEAAIQEAGAAMEAHWAEYEKLTDDPERVQALAVSLFAEQCFVPLRFTADEVQRAFDHVGHPGMGVLDQKAAKTLLAAILHLADETRRKALARRLLLLLPELVAAGRHLEAWLVNSCAYQTGEKPDQSNVFLYHMFVYGYDALMAERRAKDEALLREVGIDLDRLREMNMDELEAWIQAQESDPAKAKAMEAFFRRHPHLRAQSEADLEAMERNLAKLLEREDSRWLLLPGEETQPWMEDLNERMLQAGFGAQMQAPGASEESVRKLFQDLAVPLIREMADAIFTRDRLVRLMADLRKYRGELFAVGDKKAAQLATGAINYLKPEDSPGQNSFLLALCWRSLDSLIRAMRAETGA